ncbi:alpha-ketoacid dehydrogenase subunit beta [Bradyrhizobium sp. UFLA05-112]
MASKKYLTQAINEALFEEMERNENIIVIGEDVELAIMGDTRGLVGKFGHNRVRNTPICEASLTAMALGATAAGYHVVLHMMFANFVYTGFDAIANQISKMRLMTGGQLDIPVTFLACYGGGGSNAAQHSDSAHPVLMNLGGINVAMPSNAADAKGLLKTALRSKDPCFFLEAAARGGQMGEVPDGDYIVPFGKAAVAREGRDVTIVSFGSAMKWSLDAAASLAKSGIEAEVIDLRTVAPIDEDAILKSLAKTGRLVVVDESRDRCGAGSHIASIAADKGFSLLKAPVKKVNIPDVAIPYAPAAELAVLPTAEKVEATVRRLLA